MPPHTFQMSEEKALLVHGLVSSHMSAMKNWIVSAVRSGDYDRARELAEELRHYEALYPAFNLRAKSTTQPGSTTHVVVDR